MQAHATWGITSYDYFRDGQVGGLQGPFVERVLYHGNEVAVTAVKKTSCVS